MMELLRMYRHDVMNDLQVVQGYASMGKVDKVQTKLAEWMEHLNEERKLMSLNIPKFALWLIQFNSVHANIRLSYDIHMENGNLHILDDTLVNQCQWCIESLEKYLDDMELYNGNAGLYSASSAIEVRLSLAADISEQAISALNETCTDKWKFCKEDNGIICYMSIPFTK
jgi:stage 0 sporulation protein B (sporulation initiation phosphotransferase)